MKYGLLSYAENSQFFNVGDNIQSLAAKQFLPKVDELVNREKLGAYTGDKMKLILNGWFTHNASNWVPSKDIEPLFISFHINNTAAPLMLSDIGVAYLKKHEPIGCRDQYTADILTEKGINAYFSGCLTLTLDSYKIPDNERTENIYIVDPLYGYVTHRKVFRNFKSLIKKTLNGEIFKLGKRERHIKKIISKDLLQSAIKIHQEPPAKTYSEEQKFEMADDLLKKYARAKLVITSRIHCALPCLAMGTPVIFINGFETFVDACRFEGITDLLNRVDVNTRTGEFSTNFPLEGKINNNTHVKNSEKYLEIAEPLKMKCREFIKA